MKLNSVTRSCDRIKTLKNEVRVKLRNSIHFFFTLWKSCKYLYKRKSIWQYPESCHKIHNFTSIETNFHSGNYLRILLANNFQYLREKAACSTIILYAHVIARGISIVCQLEKLIQCLHKGHKSWRLLDVCFTSRAVKFQLCGSIFVAPTITMNEIITVFTSTKTLFIVADSLTPIIKKTFLKNFKNIKNNQLCASFEDRIDPFYSVVFVLLYTRHENRINTYQQPQV